MLIHSKTPKLDLHGEVEAMVESLVNAFIKENYMQRKNVVRIVHGKSTNILTKETHRVLKKNPLVLDYKLNNWNLGETLVEINLKK